MRIESVYLSSRFEWRPELNACRADLEAAGLTVTSRSLTDSTPELTDQAWMLLAQQDVENIRRADALILVAEPDHPRGGGRHVEFGVAVGLGKRLVVVAVWGDVLGIAADRHGSHLRRAGRPRRSRRSDLVTDR